MKVRIILLLLFAAGITSCDYFISTRDVNGSVFIVTKGAETYRLALVKVCFFDSENLSGEIAALNNDYEQELKSSKDKCDRLQKEFDSLLSQRLAAHSDWEKQCSDDAPLIASYRDTRSKLEYFIKVQTYVDSTTQALVDKFTYPPVENKPAALNDSTAPLNDGDLIATGEKIASRYENGSGTYKEESDSEMNIVQTFVKARTLYDNARKGESQKLDVQHGIEEELATKQTEYNTQ